eukprot:363217-Chlamydomonas_euryale.AAC.3
MEVANNSGGARAGSWELFSVDKGHRQGNGRTKAGSPPVEGQGQALHEVRQSPEEQWRAAVVVGTNGGLSEFCARIVGLQGGQRLEGKIPHKGEGAAGGAVHSHGMLAVCTSAGSSCDEPLHPTCDLGVTLM